MSSTAPNTPKSRAQSDTQTSYPEPIQHGYAGQIVINDAERDKSTLGTSLPPNKKFPSGSLYQAARAEYYHHDEDPAVLATDYSPSWLPTSEEYAVVLKSSRWKAGKGEGENYSPRYKYDLTLRPVNEDGEVEHDRNPLQSLSLKLQPQQDGLRYPDGDPLSLPYGQGTKVAIQTTWADPQEAEQRARELVEYSLPYQVNPTEIDNDSRRFWKGERHARFSADKEPDVTQVIRESGELIPHLGGSADTHGEAKSGSWLECKLKTDNWEELGYPDIEYPILLKVYYTEDPETSPAPFNQPKIEAALAGNPNKKKPHARQWDEIQEALKTIVTQHLADASVSPEQLVADDMFDPNSRPDHTWEYHDRRAQLRDYYQSLRPDLYRVATNPQTDLTYDILAAITEQGAVTYDDLEEYTGAARSTIRRQVRKLENLGGDHAPGAVKRIQDAETWVVAPDEAEEHMREVKHEAKPGDTPEERESRAQERRDTREENTPPTRPAQPNNDTGGPAEPESGGGSNLGTHQNETTTFSPGDGFRSATQAPTQADQWQRLDASPDITREAFMRAMRQDAVSDKDVKVRIEALHLDPPGE